MFFDSHAHLDDAQFDADRDSLIASFADAGISHVLIAGSSIRCLDGAVRLAEQYPFLYAAAGVHPHETSDMTMETLDRVEQLLRHEKCVALGEIGLDYFYDFSQKDDQRYWFFQQLSLAHDLDMPVIIHDREAHQECFDAVAKAGVRGVFHCYSGSAEMAKQLVRIGFYCSFTGVVTYKNARRALESIAAIPLERILIETDSPYLTPEPYRGERNDPRHVIAVAEKIAEIKGCSTEEVARITAENTRRLFRIN